MSNTVLYYKIYELDNNHGLAKKERPYNDSSKRIVFVETEGYNLSDDFNSMDEAINALKKHADKYTKYTIIPEIYLRNE